MIELITKAGMNKPLMGLAKMDIPKKNAAKPL
jgi:hypothetical protein